MKGDRDLVSIERSLGLRSVRGISRQSNKDSPPIKAILEGIKTIATAYVNKSNSEIRASHSLRQDALDLLDQHGPEIWPSPEYERPPWLEEPSEYKFEGKYPRHLYFSDLDDRRILGERFYSLVVEKCCNYHDNQLQKHRRVSAKKQSSHDESASATPRREDLPWFVDGGHVDGADSDDVEMGGVEAPPTNSWSAVNTHPTHVTAPPPALPSPVDTPEVVPHGLPGVFQPKREPSPASPAPDGTKDTEMSSPAETRSESKSRRSKDFGYSFSDYYVEDSQADHRAARKRKRTVEDDEDDDDDHETASKRSRGNDDDTTNGNDSLLVKFRTSNTKVASILNKEPRPGNFPSAFHHRPPSPARTTTSSIADGSAYQGELGRTRGRSKLDSLKTETIIHVTQYRDKRGKWYEVDIDSRPDWATDERIITRSVPRGRPPSNYVNRREGSSRASSVAGSVTHASDRRSSAIRQPSREENEQVAPAQQEIPHSTTEAPEPADKENITEEQVTKEVALEQLPDAEPRKGPEEDPITQEEPPVKQSSVREPTSALSPRARSPRSHSPAPRDGETIDRLQERMQQREVLSSESSESPERGEKLEKLEKAEKPARPAGPARPEKQERPERPERPENPEELDKPARQRSSVQVTDSAPADPDRRSMPPPSHIPAQVASTHASPERLRVVPLTTFSGPPMLSPRLTHDASHHFQGGLESHLHRHPPLQPQPPPGFRPHPHIPSSQHEPPQPPRISGPEPPPSTFRTLYAQPVATTGPKAEPQPPPPRYYPSENAPPRKHSLPLGVPLEIRPDVPKEQEKVNGHHVRAPTASEPPVRAPPPEQIRGWASVNARDPAPRKAGFPTRREDKDPNPISNANALRSPGIGHGEEQQLPTRRPNREAPYAQPPQHAAAASNMQMTWNPMVDNILSEFSQCPVGKHLQSVETPPNLLAIYKEIFIEEPQARTDWHVFNLIADRRRADQRYVTEAIRKHIHPSHAAEMSGPPNPTQANGQPGKPADEPRLPPQQAMQIDSDHERFGRPHVARPPPNPNSGRYRRPEPEGLVPREADSERFGMPAAMPHAANPHTGRERLDGFPPREAVAGAPNEQSPRVGHMYQDRAPPLAPLPRPPILPSQAPKVEMPPDERATPATPGAGGGASLENVIVEINWGGSLEFTDYMQMKDCSTAKEFFELVEAQLPDELRGEGKKIKEIRAKARTDLVGGSRLPRITRDEGPGRVALRQLVKKLRSQPPGAEPELEFLVIWKGIAAN